jgi:hypothetical protein
MSALQYNLVDTGEHSNITVFLDGEMYVADDTHPNWGAIRQGALDRDESVVALFDRGAALADYFVPITERVSVANGRVFFDGDEVDNAVTQGLVRAMDEGADFRAVARFLENLAANPSEHSKENLYRWIKDRHFSITEDGCLIGYKGVNKDSEGNFVSVSSGTAIVDGETHTGQIPNYVGAVVMMPRSTVTHDPAVHCHVGLHVGTWSYASNFGGGGTLTVKVNPRDVVSVPEDWNSEKMRVCRYEVIELTESAISKFLAEYDTDDDWDEFEGLEEWEEELLGLNVPEVVKVEEVKKRSFWPFK